MCLLQCLHCTDEAHLRKAETERPVYSVNVLTCLWHLICVLSVGVRAYIPPPVSLLVCAFVCVYVCACARVCVCVWGGGGVFTLFHSPILTLSPLFLPASLRHDIAKCPSNGHHRLSMVNQPCVLSSKENPFLMWRNKLQTICRGASLAFLTNYIKLCPPSQKNARYEPTGKRLLCLCGAVLCLVYKQKSFRFFLITAMRKAWDKWKLVIM